MYVCVQCNVCTYACNVCMYVCMYVMYVMYAIYVMYVCTYIRMYIYIYIYIYYIRTYIRGESCFCQTADVRHDAGKAESSPTIAELECGFLKRYQWYTT